MQAHPPHRLKVTCLNRPAPSLASLHGRRRAAPTPPLPAQLTATFVANGAKDVSQAESRPASRRGPRRPRRSARWSFQASVLPRGRWMEVGEGGEVDGGVSMFVGSFGFGYIIFI